MSSVVFDINFEADNLEIVLDSEKSAKSVCRRIPKLLSKFPTLQLCVIRDHDCNHFRMVVVVKCSEGKMCRKIKKKVYEELGNEGDFFASPASIKVAF